MKGWLASMPGDREGKGAVCSTMKRGSSRRNTAVRAIQVLANVESKPLTSQPPVFSLLREPHASTYRMVKLRICTSTCSIAWSSNPPSLLFNPSLQQLALLVSGLLLVCNWQFILQNLQQFDSRGFRSLLEVWLVVAASFGLGRVAALIARAAGADSSILVAHQPTLEQETANSSSRTCSSSSGSSVASIQLSIQECIAVGDQNEPGSAAVPKGQQVDDHHDDIGLQKKAAQAAAAAKRAECQGHLRQLLVVINSSVHPISSSSSSSTSALHQLAEVLFESPMNVCELVDLGGVPVMMAAARSAVEALTTDQNHEEVLPVLLQVSWVLLQIAHGPPACCGALGSQHVVTTLLALIKAIAGAADGHPDSKERILRNFCWTILLVCDTKQRASGNSQQHTSHAGSASDEAAAAGTTAADTTSELCASGAVDVLQQLLSLQCGVSPGWVAAATLGLITQLGQQQCSALCQAALQALLQRDSLHGLGYLLSNQPQLSDRLQGLVYGQLHHLLTAKTAELLQLLVEEQLVGVFAASLPLKLSRLLVCRLLSSRGQEVLARVEAAYELDAALALAQIIPLPVHLKLPTPPGSWQQQSQQLQREMGPAVDVVQKQILNMSAAKQSAAAAEDMYTNILACRLLLQYDRLTELLTAFADELLEHHQHHQHHHQQQQQQHEEQVLSQYVHQTPALTAASKRQQVLPPVCDAVFELIRHLMSRDLQLQAVQHDRGASIDDSQSAANSSAGSSNSSSSGIEAALAAADASGVYSTVMEGLVSSEQPQAAACDGRWCCGTSYTGSCGAGVHRLQLPSLPVSAPAAASSNSIKGRPVVFKFGQLQHTVSASMYQQICSSSKMISSILRREGKRPIHPVIVFATPHFAPEANYWVLQCLERWLSTGHLAGFTADQAAKLWVAADFWQVDGLQVACEDVLAAAAAKNTAHLEVALELCLRHRVGSMRLQRLAAQILMNGVADSATADGCSSTCVYQLLQRLLVQYKMVLLPGLLSEMRDRLVVLCMLNVGLHAETLEEMVE